ncbi:MAG: nucleoside deaminase [Deltaproteobacteria bacterium]|nr:nucleoside deaminase [Deltaproteobacteria bacterium]
MSYMKEALELATQAAAIDEVPVGAVIVRKHTIIAKAYNLRESDQCATSHAEIIAIRQACTHLKSWRLTDCHLYVTLEPCLMCSGAIIQSRLPFVTYAAKDPKGGAMGSLYSLHMDDRLNHQPEVISGEHEEESSQLLRHFFQKKRQQQKNKPSMC